MKAWLVLSLLACTGAFLTKAQNCNLTGALTGDKYVEFPNIEGKDMESYLMSVEYTLPNAAQTDFYVEYYDIIGRRGRVEAHQKGELLTYLYRTEYNEAWEISSDACKLQNISETPEMYRDNEEEWTYKMSDEDEDFDKKITIGPSAMFKNAYDVFQNDQGRKKTGYMGKTTVNGLEAQFWRRCIQGEAGEAYVDYFFSTEQTDGPFKSSLLKVYPMRVSYQGRLDGQSEEFSNERYEILNFQPLIPKEMTPFEIPRGKGCRRRDEVKAPEIPNFLENNLEFMAEVIYRKINRLGEETEYQTYYSNLIMAIDKRSQHLFYQYAPWDSANKKDEDGNPAILPEERVIFDMKHKYVYRMNFGNDSCVIGREKTFEPQYKLPEDAGYITLTDSSVLFPNNELLYLSEGTHRGLKVNVYEAVFENYDLSKFQREGGRTVSKAIITHSYLKENEVENNVLGALAQVQLRLIDRATKVIEVLTLNFFDFTTDIDQQFYLFNVYRCFKNDDDYAWVTIGFSADKATLDSIKQKVPGIQSRIFQDLRIRTELNPLRVPYTLVDVDDALYVKMLIVDKPPIMLDYLPKEENKVIVGSTEAEGVTDLLTCASMCLEVQDDCWGISYCGAKCIFGTAKATEAKDKNGCELYRRYNTSMDFIPSKELLIEGIRGDVKSLEVRLMLKGKDGETIQLDATSIFVEDVGEDDSIFRRIGGHLNPRMQVKKSGYKLKKTAGNEIKNMGQLRYDQCQRLCLDFKDCETMSYCLTKSQCLISTKYGDEIRDNEIEEDNMCNLLQRKYQDHFQRSPGVILSNNAQETMDLKDVDSCARACLKKSNFECLSFDHCPNADKGQCKLHTVYYPNPSTREPVQKIDTDCGHYFRKYSLEFNKKPQKRVVGTKIAPLTKVTLEECAKACKDYADAKGNGCYGFDFCEGSTLLSSSCTLLDSDPLKLTTTYSPICDNYHNKILDPAAPRPYSNGYAGGIGFLCFVIGAVVGAVIVFGIAYFKVNRR